ncbi:MAG: polymer-forming cytoskeletal protein [Elusimicrobiota bacterium]|nr:MAG: polymer-forming cytoskeletal protein [Elusimicrobiota bacterium]
MFGEKSARGDAREGMTLISEDAFFHGSLVVKGSLRVEGVFEGDISDAVDVEVGAKGRVVGNVAAETIVVAGEVVGDIVASRSLEILASGRVTGDIRVPKLKIDDGAFFDGSCAMGGADDKPRRRRARAEAEASGDGAYEKSAQ